MIAALHRVPAVLLVCSALVACYPDDTSGDSGDDAGRGGRNPDIGGPDAPATDAGADAAFDSAAPNPGAGFTDFDTAWTAYEDVVRAVAYLQACPCMIQFGLANSQADCESQIGSQLDSQLGCIEFAMREREASALGSLNCQIPLYEDAQRCLDTSDLDCLNMPECGPAEADLADCELVLTTDQRDAIDRCTPDDQG